jgi:glutamate dehydrogenase
MNADNVAGAKAASASSGASDTKAGDDADRSLVDSLSHILQQGALPGELEDFSDEDTRAAAAFIAQCASRRPPGKALVRVESFGTQLGRRRMRICIANDDMPFLVDSVAGRSPRAA